MLFDCDSSELRTSCTNFYSTFHKIGTLSLAGLDLRLEQHIHPSFVELAFSLKTIVWLQSLVSFTVLIVTMFYASVSVPLLKK